MQPCPASFSTVQKRCISNSGYYYDKIPDRGHLSRGKGSLLAHSLRGVVTCGEGMATGESVAMGGLAHISVDKEVEGFTSSSMARHLKVS